MAGIAGRCGVRGLSSTTLLHRTATRGVKLAPGLCASSSKDNKQKTPQDWQEELTAEQYYVTREGGTEPPFSGSYYKHHEEGLYQCTCCGADVFSSATKFESGSGWPSFHSAEGKEGESVETRSDTSLGMLRVEVMCRECKAHLGHVFPDGPQPTGLRYCINSIALNFTPKKIT